MKISETIFRECCQLKDLQPVFNSYKTGPNTQFIEWKFCKYCGRRHRYTQHPGGQWEGWGYMPVVETWELKPKYEE